MDVLKWHSLHTEKGELQKYRRKGAKTGMSHQKLDGGGGGGGGDLECEHLRNSNMDGTTIIHCVSANSGRPRQHAFLTLVVHTIFLHLLCSALLLPHVMHMYAIYGLPHNVSPSAQC